jgi:hypothetical protein
MMYCPTGLSGLGGAADQIDVTSLSDTVDKKYVRGLGNPGQLSAPFIFEPSQASHQDLFTLQASGEVLKWMICLSEGVAAPTLGEGELIPPTDRTSIAFDAYISDVAIDVGSNEIVKGTLTLQRSGPIKLTPKG